MACRKWNTAPTLRQVNPNWDEWALKNSIYVPETKPKNDKGARSVWGIWKRIWRVRCKDGWTDVEYCRQRYLFDHCVSEWSKFDRFYADVGPRPEGGMLVRINPEKPFGPKNFRWAQRSEFATNSLSYGRAYIICERLLSGESPTKISDDMNVSRQTVYRIKSGKTHPGLYSRLKFLEDEFC